MRHLVYRVQPLPASMLPIIWDFGQLNDEAERLYINQIVRVRFSSYKTIPKNHQELIVGMLASSQTFMRSQQNECSFVSLRDVQRVISIVQWFLEHGEPIFEQIRCKKNQSVSSTIENKPPKPNPRGSTVTNLIDSIILALNICYHVKLQDDNLRTEYRKMIADYVNKFEATGSLKITEHTMLKEIDYCYQVFYSKC